MSHPRVLPWWPIILPTSTPSLWAKLNNSWTASASVMKLLALHRSYSNRTWMEMLSKKRSALGFCQKMVPCGTPRFPWINILVLLMEIAIWMGTALGPIFRHAHTTIPLLVLHPIYPNKYPHEIPEVPYSIIQPLGRLGRLGRLCYHPHQPALQDAHLASLAEPLLLYLGGSPIEFDTLW